VKGKETHIDFQQKKKKRMSQFFCDRPKCDAIFLRQSNSTFVLRLLRPMLVRHKDKNATLVRKSLRRYHLSAQHLGQHFFK
jgi:hypothetical protein